jgi:predicted Rossmann fold nucleotide-binding protein DprA/Smf involved in DNA uptake
MKVIICGDRLIEDYAMVCQAVKESGFKITEVVSGKAKGVDSLGERWAIENDITIKEFPAKWNDTKRAGAKIKINDWGKEYDSDAGLVRNEKMAKYADACIAVQGENDSSGTQHMIKTAEKAGIKVFVYKKKKKDSDYEYHF